MKAFITSDLETLYERTEYLKVQLWSEMEMEMEMMNEIEMEMKIVMEMLIEM